MNQVTLTLEEYNKLLLQNELIKRAVHVRTSFDTNSLMVEFDPRVVAGLIEEKVLDRGDSEEWVVTDLNEWYPTTVHIASRNPTHLVVEDESE